MKRSIKACFGRLSRTHESTSHTPPRPRPLGALPPTARRTPQPQTCVQKPNQKTWTLQKIVCRKRTRNGMQKCTPNKISIHKPTSQVPAGVRFLHTDFLTPQSFECVEVDKSDRQKCTPAGMQITRHGSWSESLLRSCQGCQNWTFWGSHRHLWRAPVRWGSVRWIMH